MIPRPVVWLPIFVIAIASTIGALIWIDTIADIAAEATNPSTEGPEFGRDFAAFQQAGHRVVDDESGSLYDFEIETTRDPSPFRNPPFYALFMVPYSAVGFMPGFLAWTVVGAVCLAAGLLLLGVRYPIAWFTGILFTLAGLLNLFYGQNSFFTFLLLSSSYASLKARRSLIGGSFVGVVAYKPQLLGGFVVWLMVRHRSMRGVIAGVVLSLGALVTISWLLMPDAWPEFWNKTLTTDPDMPNAPVHFTLRHAALLLMPQQQVLAFVLYVAAVGTVVAGQLWFLRHVGKDLDLAFAGAVSVSILIAPRGLAYDWVLLAIPLALVWTRQPDKWKTWLWLTAALVAAVSITSQFSKWQVEKVGIALHLAPVVLFAILIVAARAIVDETRHATTLPT